ncbi:hypothetical protein PUN28_019617 [Cardiocondyla obscurior]|uniref:Ribosomal protein S14 n=1 Tax=Cardiocondyla obscurior TaxID=286306 RepID=A0AAW2EDS8_9HYME
MTFFEQINRFNRLLCVVRPAGIAIHSSKLKPLLSLEAPSRPTMRISRPRATRLIPHDKRTLLSLVDDNSVELRELLVKRRAEITRKYARGANCPGSAKRPHFRFVRRSVSCRPPRERRHNPFVRSRGG